MDECFIAYTVSILRHLVFFFLLFQNLYLVQSNKFSRFVQFGADQDCHCGASGCRKKLGVKPSKPKMSSDAALKLVACQVAVSSPKLKAMLSAKDVCICGGFMCGFTLMLPFSFPSFLFFFSAHDMHIFLQSRLILVLLFVKVYQNGGLHVGKEVSFSMLPCFVNLMAAKFCNIVI